MDVVNDAMIYYSGQNCVDSFTSAAEAVAALYEQGVGSAGYTQLSNDFVTCEPISSTYDLTILLSDLMGNVQVSIFIILFILLFILLFISFFLLIIINRVQLNIMVNKMV